MSINLHHWHWHLVYPFEARNRRIVHNDRRGELFYYMHQQMIARYNMERFGNNLSRVNRFNNFRDPIAESYLPKMDSLSANRAMHPRLGNTQLRDLNHELDHINLDLDNLERWRDHFFTAIHQGFVVDGNGNHILLDEHCGIDILGNMMETTIISPSQAVRGDFQNMDHIFISLSDDPDHRLLEDFGVMGVMCDPVFYRWHAYIDDIFQEYKRRLPAYTLPQLHYDGISITGVQVSTDGSSSNVLTTLWQQSDLDLSHRMGITPRDNIDTRYIHLQHAPFTYTINVNNDGGAQRFGTVRIFMAPKTNERGQPMLLRDQHLMMVELDKFVVSMNPGQNIIRRLSTESSVTTQFDRTFGNSEQNYPVKGSDEEMEFSFCRCGWPNHMSIANNLPEDLHCEMFVMVSNYEDDRVDKDLVSSCSDATSCCGIRDRLYLDRRPMGYPFDRPPRQGVDRLADFLTPNMCTVDVVIRSEAGRTIVGGA